MLAATGAALLTLIGALGVLRPWRGDLSVPWAGEGDALFNAALVKGLIEHGWWTRNPDLGFPAGQDLHDFAMGGDHAHVALLWVFGRLAGEAGTALNLYFLFALCLSAVTAYAVLRRLGAEPLVSVTCAVLFALSPWAFLRGETHITLAAWPVPIAAWLVLSVWGGERLFGPRRTTLLTVAACVVVGSTGSFYFATFTVVLVVVAGLARWWSAGERRAAAAAGLVVAALALTCAINLAPTALYALDHGRNDEVGERFASESDFHGLKLALLVLPVEDHRIAALGDVRRDYQATGQPPERTEAHWSALGAVGTAGLLWLAVVLVASVSPGRRPRLDERHRRLAGAALVAFLVGTMGGLGAIFAYAVTPQLRGWNRIGIFIAFFAVAAAALLLDALARRLRERDHRWRIGVPVLLAGVLGLGLLDQTTNAFIPPYDDLRARDRSDARFVAAIEERLGRGGAVLQVPAMRFPESEGVHGVGDYEPLRGYLHGDGLRWSYGAMKGRAADWQGALGARPIDQVLVSAVAVGFGGLSVDREGFPERAGALERDLARLAGPPAVVSPDGRFAFWQLDRVARAVRVAWSPQELRAARRATLRPLRLAVPDADVRPLKQGEGRWGVRVRSLRLTVENPGPEPRRAVLALAVTRPARPSPRVRVRLPGGAVRPLARGRLRTRVTLPAGRTVLELETTDDPVVVYDDEPGVAYVLSASVTDDVLLDRGARFGDR